MRLKQLFLKKVHFIMDVKLLSGALGAEISGISLNNINQEMFNNVNELF